MLKDLFKKEKKKTLRFEIQKRVCIILIAYIK